MNIKCCLFCLSIFALSSFIQNCYSCTTESINKNNIFYFEKDNPLYRNVNYNIDKYIRLASNKYGKKYWAYEAITTGNEWSSSIDGLKKLLVLAVNTIKENDIDRVFNSLYSKILEKLDSLVIDKSLTIEERLKTDACKEIFGYMNALTVYGTLNNKFNFKHSSSVKGDPYERFEYIYKKILFFNDVGNKNERIEFYEDKIIPLLLKIFDGDEEYLKMHLFHDWKCYLYQFSVIANGTERDLAVPHPSTVLSTVINLGLYQDTSRKITCAKTFLTSDTARELVYNVLNDMSDIKTVFNTIHEYLDTTEEKVQFEKIIQSINNVFKTTFFPNLVYSKDDRYYDYDYINLLYNFGFLKKRSNDGSFDFDTVVNNIIKKCHLLFENVSKQKLKIHINSAQDLDIINLLNIFTQSLIVYDVYNTRLVKNNNRNFNPQVIDGTADIILKLFKYISYKNLNNCHETAFENIFWAINNVGVDKTFSLLNDVFAQKSNIGWVGYIHDKQDFYGIASSIHNESGKENNKLK